MYVRGVCCVGLPAFLPLKTIHAIEGDILISVHLKATVVTPYPPTCARVAVCVLYFGLGMIPFSLQRLLHQAPVSLDLFASIALNLPPRHFNWGPFFVVGAVVKTTQRLCAAS